MEFLLRITLLGAGLCAVSTCVALSVPAEVSSLQSPTNEYDPEILELYRPTDEERILYPSYLWYFDHPDLLSDPSYLLTNDYGTSSAHLVEASNKTYWSLQSRSSSSRTSINTGDLNKRASIQYINSYLETGCVQASFDRQVQNPQNGLCYNFSNWQARSAFIVGEGDHQVNFYGPQGRDCWNNYVGAVRGYNGCWTMPRWDAYIENFWPCYTC